MIFADTVDRVRSLYLKSGMSIGDFFERAGSFPCVCNVPGQLRDSWVASVEWHDRYEFYGNEPSSRRKLGEWMNAIIHGAFRDRATVLSFEGARGSGKSTVTRVVYSWFEPPCEESGECICMHP